MKNTNNSTKDPRTILMLQNVMLKVGPDHCRVLLALTTLEPTRARFVMDVRLNGIASQGNQYYCHSGSIRIICLAIMMFLLLFRYEGYNRQDQEKCSQRSHVLEEQFVMESDGMDLFAEKITSLVSDDRRSSNFNCDKHHEMNRNVIDKYETNIFWGNGYLHFRMEKIRIVLFTPIDKRCFNLTLALFFRLCYQNPFSVEIQFALCRELLVWIFSESCLYRC